MTRPEPSNASRSQKYWSQKYWGQKYWSQTTFMITQRKSSLILNLVSKSRSSTLFWKFIRQVSSTKAHSLLKKLENYKKFPQTEREKNTQYTIPLAKQTQVAISLPSNSFPTGRRPLPRVVQVVAISANHPSWPFPPTPTYPLQKALKCHPKILRGTLSIIMQLRGLYS